MRYFILLPVLFICIQAQAQLEYKTKSSIFEFEKSRIDSTSVMENTRVNSPCGYLSNFEREIIQWLNIARMYPKWFIYFNKLENSGDDYATSLYEKLNTMDPIPHKLEPDSLLWVSADCHAKTSGPQGYVGHNRQNSKCKIRGAECIQYGELTPAEIIESLLIDREVPSHGHRLICLNPFYKIVGIAVGDHKTYDKLCVIDFR